MGVRGKSSGGGHNKSEEAVAVAIDKDKGSQHAIKWTVDNLLTRGQALTLLHVKHPTNTSPHTAGHGTEDAGKVHINPTDTQSKELFLPFRCYCTKKAIRCSEVIIEDFDISRALLNYVNNNQMEILVLGAPSKSGIFRYKDLYVINSKFMTTDVPSTVSKKAPEFCSVYVISRGKISFMRSASISVPRSSSSTSNQMEHQSSKVSESNDAEIRMRNNKIRALERAHYQSERMQHTQERNQFSPRILLHEDETIMSPFSRGKHAMNKTFELPPDSDISFVSSGSPRMERVFNPFYESMSSLGSRNSNNSEMESRSSTASYSGTKFIDMCSSRELSSSSFDSVNSWSSSDDVEAEMRRLRLELKQTREMYSTACKEAVTAKHKVKEVDRWKLEEEMRLEEVRVAEGVALAAIEKEKARCKAAIEAAEAAHRVAELEAQKRRHAELNAIKDTEQRIKAVEGRSFDIVRYRKYSIEDIETATFNFSKDFKIGEGGYGPVYKGELDHTAVAIKILRPDAAHGQSQFRQEVEVLSCIRHPNMVLLLGACPEYGCLVYEYMANGSLEDRLFRRGNTPTIPWQLRFRIAAEIGTGLLFLHQTKPEPLVHRDLKPGNILLNQNYVSKISDVGLARLVPPSVANNVTQYRMTSTAGTFCYIDPEYQQTGMLGVKSDVYSLGVLLLQIITARQPMGLTHHVEEAIQTGTFAEMLDPTVSDWPVEEALSFAKLALQCAEMRRRDRPDLGKAVLPELNRLKELAHSSMNHLMFGGSEFSAKQAMMSSSSRQDVMSDSNLAHTEYDSQSSTSSHPGR